MFFNETKEHSFLFSKLLHTLPNITNKYYLTFKKIYQHLTTTIWDEEKHQETFLIGCDDLSTAKSF